MDLYSESALKLRREILKISPISLSRLLNISLGSLFEIEFDSRLIQPGLGCLISRLLLVSEKLQVFMTGDEIMQWLENPNPRLENKRPIDCLRNMKDNSDYHKVSRLVDFVATDTAELIHEAKTAAKIRITHAPD